MSIVVCSPHIGDLVVDLYSVSRGYSDTNWVRTDLLSAFILACCLQLVSELRSKIEHPSKSTYFIAAGTFAVEARDLMLAEMVLTSRAEPPFRARLLNDLHAIM